MAAVPVIARQAHPVRIGAPFFAKSPAVQSDTEGGGAVLLRYQDAEFIPRFLTELAAGRLGDPTQSDWWRGDRFSAHDGRLVLRLPIHRTFYLVVCELTCDRLGSPALDPARIGSAGFVIRRLTRGEGGRGAVTGKTLADDSGRELMPRTRDDKGSPEVSTRGSDLEIRETRRGLSIVPAGGEQQWTLEEGEPLGWGAIPSRDRDPDLNRRACLNGVLRRVPRPAAFSGEETHPLHAITARDAGGKLHTLLYGFLPLGGQSLPQTAPFDPADERAAAEADRARLPWPFGYLGRANRVWLDSDALQVDAGRPSAAFFALAEVLVNRYHLGHHRSDPGAEGSDPLNLGLAEAAGGLGFTDPWTETLKGQGGGREPGLLFALSRLPETRFSLLDYLESCFDAGDANPLLPWLAEERRRIDAAGGITAPGAIAPLPARPRDSGSTLDLDLRLSQADAEEWRLLLGQRLIDQARRTGSEIPIPKFRQGPGDLFQVLPFVRAVDDEGRERITWASAPNRSVPFGVAAPFDPDASRPTLIQMPSLRDLRRGLAKGAAMLVPPDTQGLMDRLKVSEGVGPDMAEKPPPNAAGLGVQWICSFSIPVVTLVAMILLMIVVMILNILFFWLPWVRICLPFPKIK